jgi:hypothetical protein
MTLLLARQAFPVVQYNVVLQYRTEDHHHHITTEDHHCTLAKPCDPAMMMPTITPNSPRALPKISTTRIFTNSVEFWASDSAQLLPTMPTHILQTQQQAEQSRAAAAAARKATFQ